MTVSPEGMGSLAGVSRNCYLPVGNWVVSEIFSAVGATVKPCFSRSTGRIS